MKAKSYSNVSGHTAGQDGPPIAKPAGTQPGDLLIAFGNGTSPDTLEAQFRISGGSAWNTYYSSQGWAIYWKIAGASEPDTYTTGHVTWTVFAHPSLDVTATVVCYATASSYPIINSGTYTPSWGTPVYSAEISYMYAAANKTALCVVFGETLYPAGIADEFSAPSGTLYEDTCNGIGVLARRLVDATWHSTWAVSLALDITVVAADGGLCLFRAVQDGCLRLFYVDGSGGLIARRYDPDDASPAEVTLDADTASKFPSFWERGGIFEGTYLQDTSGKLARSYDGGRSWSVDTVPGGPWEASASCLHRNRIVFLGYKSSQWYCRVADIQADETLSWSGSDVSLSLTSPDKKGAALYLDGDILVFAWQNASGTPYLSRCYALGKDGTGSWI